MNAISKIAPWVAKPLSDAAKEEHFRQSLDLQAERILLGRSAILAGWWIGGAGVAVGLAGIICAASVFPLKTVELRYFLVDRTTGYVTESLGAKDAPTLFNEQTAQHYLMEYVEARESYVPDVDRLMMHKAAVMSSPEEQARIAAERRDPESVIAKLGKSGHVGVENFRITPRGVGKNGTFSYLVRFDRTVFHGEIADSAKPWSAVIDFQWHPELPMTMQDRQINPAGFQAIAYRSLPDTPDMTRR